MAQNGGAAVFHGGFDPLGRGLKACQTLPGCRPYAVDDRVVWVKPTGDAAHPAAQLVQRTVPAGTATLLDFSYSVNPDCSLRGLPKLVLSKAPQHGVVQIGERVDFPHFPAGSTFASCNTTRVSGAALAYKPADGFTGSDLLEFEVTDLNNQHRAYRITLTVQ